jgi:hypothetical protein
LTGGGEGFGDWQICCLRFNATFTTVQLLIGPTFSEIDSATFVSSASSAGRVPAWWPPPVTPTTKFYSSSDFHPGFSNGKALLAYDTATRTASIYWDGWD